MSDSITINNLGLWDSFGKTNPKYTKSASVDGNKLTSLDGVYMVKLATEALGPIGEGWGYRIIEERLDNTKPIMMKTDGKLAILRDGDSIVWEQNHTILLEMWHGKRENVYTQFGHTKYRYMKHDNSKLIIDNEYAKKSVTDAMKKCLSLIGICADVFMGEFDNANYQAAAQLENDLKKADDKDAEYISKTQEFNDYIADKCKAMSKCPNFDAMQKIYGLAVQKVDRESPILGINPVEAKMNIDQMYHAMDNKFKGGQNAAI